MEASILPVGRAGSMVGFSQEFTCSQVKPLVPRETLYPQLLYDSSNAQPPENKKDKMLQIFTPQPFSPPQLTKREEDKFTPWHCIYSVTCLYVRWISEEDVAFNSYALCMFQFNTGETDTIISNWTCTGRRPREKMQRKLFWCHLAPINLTKLFLCYC